MSTPQDQYKQAVQQTQDAFQSAIDSWTKTVQQGFGSVPTAPTQVDPKQAAIPGVVAPDSLPAFKRDGSILPPTGGGS